MLYDNFEAYRPPGYPVVKITFVKKDLPLALKIKEVIKGGTIVHPKNSGYIDLLFQDVKSLQKFAVLRTAL
jgi:hypothetical protein